MLEIYTIHPYQFMKRINKCFLTISFACFTVNNFEFTDCSMNNIYTVSLTLPFKFLTERRFRQQTTNV